MPSSECKDAERRIGKDIGRFGTVKLRNNAEKIYNEIFKILKQRIRSVKQSVETSAKRLM